MSEVRHQSMYKVLQHAAKLERKADKIEYLRSVDRPQLRAMLCAALDPTVEFDLPEGRPPFNENEWKYDQEDALYAQMKKFYLFLKGPNKIFGNEYNPDVKPRRREQIFIQFLESLQADDAELVLCALEKRLPFKGLPVSVINAAFPGLITVLEKTKEEEKEQVDG